jgi:hypothetical protein
LCVRLNKQGDSSGVFSTNGPHLDDSIPSLLIDEIKADEFWWFDVYKPDMIVTEVPAAVVPFARAQRPWSAGHDHVLMFAVTGRKPAMPP